jgi:hypothetical protein
MRLALLTQLQKLAPAADAAPSDDVQVAFLIHVYTPMFQTTVM